MNVFETIRILRWCRATESFLINDSLKFSLTENQLFFALNLYEVFYDSVTGLIGKTIEVQNQLHFRIHFQNLESCLHLDKWNNRVFFLSVLQVCYIVL